MSAALFMLAGSVIAVPRAARAQVIPVRLKIGIVELTDSDAKNVAGNPLYTGEADLVLPSFLGPVGSSILTAGYQDRSDSGRQLQVVPLTISKTSNVPNPASILTGNLYYGAGLGAYLLHADDGAASESKTAFGGFVVAGYQLPVSGVFAEVKYQLVASEVLGARPNGLLILIGKHL